MVDRHDGPPLPLGTVLPDPCRECGGGELVLKQSRFGLFYGCRNWPNCGGTIGAHPDGQPLGTQGSPEDRAARIEAHDLFDRLWKGKGAPIRRREAYRNLAEAMNISELHFAELDARRCREAIAIIRRRWGFLIGDGKV